MWVNVSYPLSLVLFVWAFNNGIEFAVDVLNYWLPCLYAFCFRTLIQPVVDVIDFKGYKSTFCAEDHL